MNTPFVKMHGLGNDFIVIDGREKLPSLDAHVVQKLAHRRTGIGCDQLIVITASEQGADAGMRIYNSDGSEVAACGNATRCVAHLLMQASAQKHIRLSTAAGILSAEEKTPNVVSVDMGEPGLGWQDIPLAREEDTLHLPVAEGVLSDPVGVSMGNPHAVFFVQNTDEIALAVPGYKLEHHPLFPERANIGIAQVIDRHTIKLRVWERGTGETLACGTGACAAVVASIRRNLTDRECLVHLPGGNLTIRWQEGDSHVWMEGEVASSYHGIVDIEGYAK